MKPMLASDYDPAKLVFPLIAQPKIDGVRALNLFGKLTGRSLKSFKNRHVTSQFSRSALIGFDGEMAANHECHADLCRMTTSALGTIEGAPYVLWWLFDYVTVETRDLPYRERLPLLEQQVIRVCDMDPDIGKHLRVMPSKLVGSLEELEALDEEHLNLGYEGTCIREPEGVHKSGRSTVRERGLLRIKRFLDSEAVVVGVTEGESNLNEAKVNALGHTERSTHQANMVANGMVGTLQCRALADVVDSTGKVLITQGQDITVSAGRLTGREREYYLANAQEIIGRTIKFQFFPKGIKDKPRFPTFQSFRVDEDMS